MDIIVLSPNDYEFIEITDLPILKQTKLALIPDPNNPYNINTLDKGILIDTYV